MKNFAISVVAVMALSGCLNVTDGADAITVGTPSDTSESMTLTPKITQLDAQTGQPKAGFFAGLFGASKPATPEEETEEEATPAAAPVKTSGFFGGLFARNQEHPDDVDPKGGPLPFGQLGRACGMRTRALGEKVEAAGGFKLYDSNPGALTPRSFYLTGFADRCPRKFTAGLAVLGDPMLHETVRYTAKTTPYSDLEKTYERIKSRVCNVRRKTPCEKRAEQLVAGTVFVSLYKYFGAPVPGGNLLLHDGDLAASDFDL